MKLKVVGVFLMLSITINLHSQSSFEINVSGRLSGFHRSPVALISCIEGCSHSFDKYRYSNNIEVNLIQSFNKKTHFLIGIGYSRYKFGVITEGWLLAYREDISFSFTDFSTGIRRTLLERKSLKPYIQGKFIWEIDSTRDYYNFLRTHNFALESGLGVLLNIYKKFQLNLGFNFRSGVANFLERTYEEKFIPYSFSFLIGVSFSF